MLSKIARLILALSSFPLLGAYGLRWAGRFGGEMFSVAGATSPFIMALDFIGAFIGVVCGLLVALLALACAFQAESHPVRPVADIVLIILGGLLCVDIFLPLLFQEQAWLQWLPPASLAIWMGAAAAVISLYRFKSRWQMLQPTHMVEKKTTHPVSPSPPSLHRNF